MSHKKEWFSVAVGIVMDVASNPHVISIFSAIFYGAMAWIGAKLIELAWNWAVNKIKGNGKA